MTGLRRPTIITIAALLAAGCGATPPTHDATCSYGAAGFVVGVDVQ